MSRHSPTSRRSRPARPRPASSAWPVVAAAALLAAGCEEERHVGTAPTRSRAADVVGVDQGDTDRPAARPNAAPPRPKKPTDSGPIIGQRTSDIRDVKAELRTGKAQVAAPRKISRDPFMLTGSAYALAMGRISEGQIKQAVDLYHANNDRYPKDYDEFVSEVLKPNNISLPQLPPHQKYGYDAEQRKLFILEYPDLKNPPAQ